MSELSQRVMNMVCRGIVAETNDKKGMQDVKVSLLHHEGKIAVERMQNYGFSSHSPKQSEVTVVFFGGGRDHGIIVGNDDRNSRFTGLVEGEVVIYTDEGDSIVLKRDNTVEVTTKKLHINVETEMVVQSKHTITLKADEKVTIEAPDILLKGNVQIDGNLSQATSSGAAATYTITGDTHQIGNVHVDGNIDATGTINAPGGSVGAP